MSGRDPLGYGLGLLAEECGELSAELGRAQRFGLGTPGGDGRTAIERILDEAGDVLAAVEYLRVRGAVDWLRMRDRRDRKLARLLDPGARDNLGRRLAP